MTPQRGLDVRLEGVSKAFGSQRALAGIDLEIPAGSYVAVMGANGAGKTTLLRAIAGLAAPTRGTVAIAGVDMRKSGPALRSLIGFVSHETMLYPDLTARENLRFHARLFGLERADEVVEVTAERVGAAHALDRVVRGLSRGTKQRVALARAFLHAPPILLLDEPYTGLDEAAAASLAALLQDMSTPETILVVALHEVARALDGPRRLVVLEGGRVRLDMPTDGPAEDVADTYRSLLQTGVGA